MAFTQPYTAWFTDSHDTYIEFLHEVIRTPEDFDVKIPVEHDGFHHPHKTKHCVLIFFNSGSRDMKVGKNHSTYTSGDIFAVRPDEERCGRSIPCMLDRYYLHIHPDAFSSLKNGNSDLMGIFYNRKKYTRNKITLPFEETRQIHKILVSMDNAVRFGNKSTRDLICYAKTIEILNILNNNFKNISTIEQNKNALFLNILSYIENSYPESQIINNIVKNFGISRSSLWRLFKQEINTTPTVYLQKTRLENARLLLDEGHDITYTSTRCGFSDCSHFIKKFKEKYGVTPLNYKKSHKKPTVSKTPKSLI